MNEPKEEQIKEVWEWCGFKLVSRFGGSLSQVTEYLWHYPDGNHYKDTPPIDLNNLFKWAVPKLKAWALGNSYPDKKLTLCLVSRGNKGGEAECKDPALALFWAIWKVIKEAK